MFSNLNTWVSAGILGAGAGAAGGYFLGDKDDPDRVGRGAALGGAAVASAYLAAPFVNKNVLQAAGLAAKQGSALAWKGLKHYASNMELRRAQMARRGWTRLNSIMGGYGTIGLFAGLGAVAGAYMDDESSLRGAAVGAAAGVGIRTGIRMLQGARKIPSAPGKILSALALAAGLGVAASAFYQTSAEGSPEPDDERIVRSGTRDRMRSMGADGSIVFGAHNRR